MQVLMAPTIIVQMDMPQPPSVRRQYLPGGIMRNLQIRVTNIQMQRHLGQAIQNFAELRRGVCSRPADSQSSARRRTVPHRVATLPAMRYCLQCRTAGHATAYGRVGINAPQQQHVNRHCPKRSALILRKAASPGSNFARTWRAWFHTKFPLCSCLTENSIQAKCIYTNQSAGSDEVHSHDRGDQCTEHANSVY